MFPLAHVMAGDGWAEVGITKDAGDDPDVTHGALVIARVSASAGGVVFQAGEGVGMVTKPGLPIAPGEPAINPVPRQMICQTISECAERFEKSADIQVVISIPGGEEIAKKTWNPRLGIKGGLSILGTTGIVRPFSCSAWIASIHRGIDVARASGTAHVAGCTGATSERVVQDLHNLPEYAMLDMGDFAGGLLKYLKKNRSNGQTIKGLTNKANRQTIKRLTIGGGIGKMTKLAQGAMDLHSSRSQVDFTTLAAQFELPEVANATTALHAFDLIGGRMPEAIAKAARLRVAEFLGDIGIEVDVVVIDRSGKILAKAAEEDG